MCGIVVGRVEIDLNSDDRTSVTKCLDRVVTNALWRVRHTHDGNVPAGQKTGHGHRLEASKKILVRRDQPLLLLVLRPKVLRLFSQITCLRFQVLQHVAREHVRTKHDSDRQGEENSHDRDDVILEINHAKTTPRARRRKRPILRRRA